MQCFDAIRHPQSLSVESIDRAPVHRGGARPQCLVDAEPEADVLDEGQALRECQADLDAICAVSGGWIGRS